MYILKSCNECTLFFSFCWDSYTRRESQSAQVLEHMDTKLEGKGKCTLDNIVTEMRERETDGMSAVTTTRRMGAENLRENNGKKGHGKGMGVKAHGALI